MKQIRKSFDGDFLKQFYFNSKQHLLINTIISNLQ